MVIYRAAQSDAEILLGVIPVMLQKMVLETLNLVLLLKRKQLRFQHGI